jgi:anti-sigma factor RsiW
MTITDQELMAYADRELDPAKAAEVEAVLHAESRVCVNRANDYRPRSIRCCASRYPRSSSLRHAVSRAYGRDAGGRGRS